MSQLTYYGRQQNASLFLGASTTIGRPVKLYDSSSTVVANMKGERRK